VRKLLLSLVAMLGVAVAVLPALAVGNSPPTTASFTAVDFNWEVSGSSATQATIAQGGTVSFSYPSGISEHNADFSGGPQPSSCKQTAGTNSGAVPPLPHSPAVVGWSGTCTFNTAGTYTFHCDLHPFMTATIVVQAPVTTTSTTQSTTRSTTQSSGTTTTSSTTTTRSSSPSPGRGESPLLGGTGRAIAVAAHQRGTAVRATVKISAAGAGGELVADLFASRAALGSHPRPGIVRVGHVSRRSLHAGTNRLSIPLDAAARHALRKHRHLELTLKITVRSLHGAHSSTARKVVLRLS
jgi:plastocyanin